MKSLGIIAAGTGWIFPSFCSSRISLPCVFSPLITRLLYASNQICIWLPLQLTNRVEGESATKTPRAWTHPQGYGANVMRVTKATVSSARVRGLANEAVSLPGQKGEIPPRH